MGRALLDGKTVHVRDIHDDPEYDLSGLVSIGDYRTTLGVPLLREGTPIGVLFLTRTRVDHDLLRDEGFGQTRPALQHDCYTRTRRHWHEPSDQLLKRAEGGEAAGAPAVPSVSAA